jgi:HK97 family phage major capsid protein
MAPKIESQSDRLWEARDAAQKEYDDFMAPFSGDDAPEMTEEDITRSEELHEKLVRQEERILEVRADEKRARKIEEARSEITPAPVKVTKEPRIYDEGSDHSFFIDQARASHPGLAGHAEAVERQNAYAYEVATHLARNDKEGKRARKFITQQIRRADDSHTARDAVKMLEARGRAERDARSSSSGAEYRTPMSTALGFGGELVTPVYLESDVVPYRSAGRAFADVCNKQPLPDYGMTVYLPYVASPAGVAAQVGQNQGIQETDPTTGYLSSNLTTQAGQVTLSQQLLDRAGPNFAFDLLVWDQLNRVYAPAIDQYVLSIALANAGTITYTTTPFSLYPESGSNPYTASSFAGKVSQAKAAIRTTAGTFLNPTHLFVQPDRAEFMAAIPDSTGRPLIVSNPQGPFNAAGAGSADLDFGVEGPAGFRFAGLPVHTDYNIPAQSGESTYEQAVVFTANQVWYWEGTPVTRAVPQTLANDLAVLLQLYSYVGAIVPYPKAIQVINGAAMVAPVWTA